MNADKLNKLLKKNGCKLKFEYRPNKPRDTGLDDLTDNIIVYLLYSNCFDLQFDTLDQVYSFLGGYHAENT